MKTITVVSGKGGTGKTSVVSSLAALAKPVVLADCDVDAADLHLVLKPEVKRENTFYGAKIAHIDPDACIDCDLCEGLCRYGAIGYGAEQGHGIASVLRVDPFACEGCGVCAWFCPTQAIKMEEENAGHWFVSETEYGPMVHAKLGIAAENSGKLVTIVRNFAQGIARAREYAMLLIDGPPGIGCPVIAALTQADYALIVTEPTLSGQHDMERIAALAKHFSIPTGICINKWDLNPEISDSITKWGQETGNPVIGRIRFDERTTYAQVAGVPLVDFTTEGAAEDIRQLWDAVRGFVAETV